MSIKRRLSVQEQNAKVRDRIRIRNIATWWKEGNRLPEPIEALARDQDITRESAILVDAGEMPLCYPHHYFGRFLTDAGDSWRYEVELNEKEDAVEVLEEWSVSEVEVNAHRKGTGKSFGFLCTEVLDEIST